MAATQANYIYNKRTNNEVIRKWYQPDSQWLDSIYDWSPMHKDVKWRDDDVIVCTYPRSGTHLMGNLARMIVSQDIEKTLSYPFENRAINWFTFKDDQDGRRVLTTHAVPADFDDDVILKGNRKLIYVIRNPKATCVSYFHVLRDLSTLIVDPGSFEDYASGYSNGATAIVDKDWVTHTRAYEEYVDRYPQAPFLQVSFEDIVKDMDSMVRKVADFLEVQLTEDKIQEIVDGSTIKSMAKSGVSDEIKYIGKGGTEINFYRKGHSDDWKNHFTVALNEKFDSAISRRMQGSKIRIPK